MKSKWKITDLEGTMYYSKEGGLLYSKGDIETLLQNCMNYKVIEAHKKEFKLIRKDVGCTIPSNLNYIIGASSEMKILFSTGLVVHDGGQRPFIQALRWRHVG